MPVLPGAGEEAKAASNCSQLNRQVRKRLQQARSVLVFGSLESLAIVSFAHAFVAVMPIFTTRSAYAGHARRPDSIQGGFSKKHPRPALLMELRLNGLSGFIRSLHCDVESTILDTGHILPPRTTCC